MRRKLFMRRIMPIFTAHFAEIMYIYQKSDWPNFTWNQVEVAEKLAQVKYKQGYLLGRMQSIGFNLKAEASLRALTQEVLKSSEIEGEMLNPDQVRSSIARRLGMDIAGLVPSDRNVDGVVEMMLDATQNYDQPLTSERLFGWQASLFPAGRSGLYKVEVGGWRTNTKDDPMQVVSGPLGRERVHFQAPDSDQVDAMMRDFMNWFNGDRPMDPVLKAAVAHLWFVTVHPFDDGNGRIARAIADMQLARADQNSQRFYSMSVQIRNERNVYYDMLETTQKGDLDITAWNLWFLNCLERALEATDELLQSILKKAGFWDQYAAVSLNERQVKILNMLFDGFEGKLTSSKWAKINKCSQDTAGRDINDLIDRGILVKAPGGGRSTSYWIKEAGSQ